MTTIIKKIPERIVTKFAVQSTRPVLPSIYTTRFENKILEDLI